MGEKCLLYSGSETAEFTEAYYKCLAVDGTLISAVNQTLLEFTKKRNWQQYFTSGKRNFWNKTLFDWDLYLNFFYQQFVES